MNAPDLRQRYLHTRKRSHGSFDDTIRNASSTAEEDAQFQQLCHAVFSVHLQWWPSPVGPNWPQEHAFHGRSLPSDFERLIADAFHSDYYEPPASLARGIAGGNSMPLGDFLEEIALTVTPGQLNRIAFLTGSVGSGKSTLATHLVHRYGADWLSSRRLLAIRVDMDNGLHHDLPPTAIQKPQLLFPLYDTIHKAYIDATPLERRERDEILDQLGYDRHQPTMGHTYRAEEKLRMLYERLYGETQVSLLLIIDNLDFLYHRYDRGLFVREAAMSPGQWTPEQRSLIDERARAHQLVQYLIEALFVDNNALRQFGASILLVLREDSLQHFLSGQPDCGDGNPLDATYRLTAPPVEQVVEAHMSLLTELAKKWPTYGRRKLYVDAAQSIDPNRAGENTRAYDLHRHILALSRQGLRQVIRHYGEYIWLPVQFGSTSDRWAITNRFAEQFTPGLIAFIQGGRKHFSQSTAEFPNVYLVRADWPEEQREPWANLCRPHRHTYWLKRLLLEYIAQAEGQVPPSDIYSTFVGDGTPGFYEDHVVRLCLGSLSQVEKSYCLDYTFFTANRTEVPHQVSDVALSDRGMAIMGRLDWQQGVPFIDSFTYLQVVVDDYIMPVPNAVRDFFEYSKDFDYGYLASPDYGARVLDMLALKVKQVWIFLDVLQISLSAEEAAFASAFCELRESISIPDVADIRSRIRDDVVQIQGSLNRHANGVRRPRFDYSACLPTEEERAQYWPGLVSDLRAVYGLGEDFAPQLQEVLV